MTSNRRNVFVLASAQALALSGASLVMTVSALAGQYLAPGSGLATLPLALQFVATMLSTIPASLFMGRVGRRVGFTLGQVLGAGAAALAVLAIYQGHFVLFCIASFLIGIHNAFWQYYRFAAADSADEKDRAKAVSYVMAGGVVAAILGPELAKHSRAFFEPLLFAGSYAVLAILSLLTVGILQFVNIAKPTATELSARGRPLKEIMRQPAFIIAVLSAMLGYGVMNLVMTATPLAMIGCGFTFTEAAGVIQWHVLGMFVPSFFTGHLINRFGVVHIMLVGTLLNAACMTINLLGVEWMNFWAALLLLGVGWNFMFVGGTTLLTKTYRVEERSKVQAVNDFAVFTMVAIASFSSGALQEMIGWEAVNAAIALPLLLAFSGVLWLRISHGPTGIKPA